MSPFDRHRGPPLTDCLEHGRAFARQQAHAVKMARVHQTQHCDQCARYAWHLVNMEPVCLPGRGWHHPSCPYVSPRRPPPPMVSAPAGRLAPGWCGVPAMPPDTILPDGRRLGDIHDRPEDLVGAVADPRFTRGPYLSLRRPGRIPTYWTINGAGAATGAADAVWVSSETVTDAARTFDSDIRNFVQEVNENPNFGKRGYLQAPADQKQTHESFLTALAALTYDWWGVSDGDEQVWEDAAKDGRKRAGPAWKGTDDDVLEAIYKPEQLGFYKRLQIRMNQKLTSIGAAEFGVIMSFRARLKQIRAAYKGLGYNLTSPMSPDPVTPKTWVDSLVTALEWTAGAVVVGGAGYMVWRFLPAKSPSAPALAPAGGM